MNSIHSISTLVVSGSTLVVSGTSGDDADLNFPRPVPLLPPTLLETPDKPSRYADVLETFIDQHKLDHEVAVQILKAVYIAQKKLLPNQTVTIPPSTSFPNFISIDSKGFHTYAPSFSNGGNGSVFIGPYIAFERISMGSELFSPTKPFLTARKISHAASSTGYSPIKRKVDQLQAALSPSKRTRVGSILSTSRDDEGRRHMLMPAYSHSLDKIDWVQVEHPVHSLFQKIGDVAHALSGMHALGKVHRDIKNANIMDGKVCKLIDFDTLCDTFQEVGFTTGTPDHLNPRSFGNPETTLLMQKKRQGLQRPCDDMFAFYHMSLYLTLKLCSQLIPRSNQEAHQLIKELMRPRIYTPDEGQLNFSEKRLATLGKEHSYRAHFFHGHQKRGTPERVAIFPDASTYSNTFGRIVLSLPLSHVDRANLLEFFSFCARQKGLEDVARADAAAASTRLGEMLESLKSPQAGSSCKRAHENEEAPAKRVKRCVITQDHAPQTEGVVATL